MSVDTSVTILEKIASLIARGKTAQQIAIDADLDFTFVEQVLASQEFEDTFQTIDPKGFERWKGNQADLRAKRQVMTLAREDSVDFYKHLKDMAFSSRELKDRERADIMLALLKIAKIGEGEAPQEVVVLSDDNLKVILEAWQETEG